MRIRLLLGAVFFVLVGLTMPNIASASTGADLSLSVIPPPYIEQYAGGQTPISYNGGNNSVTWTNNGPDVATNVVLQVRMGAGVYWDAFDTTFADCALSGATVTCNLGTVQPGTSVTRTFALYPGTVGTWKVMYTISGDQLDTKQNNNTVVTKVAVIPPTHADIYLQPGGGPGYYNGAAGQPVFVWATFYNAGPADATNLVITFQLPAGVAFEPNGSNPICSGSGQAITCTYGTFYYGEQNSVGFNATAAQRGTYTITGTTHADQPDPNSANNSLTVYLQAS